MYKVFVDGSVRKNGKASIAVYVEHDGKPIYRNAWLLNTPTTSNEAEYLAVLAGLGYLSEANQCYHLEREDSFVVTDSQLVYGHVIKDWKCNFDHLRYLRDMVRDNIEKFPFKVTLVQVGRENNSVANALAQTATKEKC